MNMFSDKIVLIALGLIALNDMVVRGVTMRYRAEGCHNALPCCAAER